MVDLGRFSDKLHFKYKTDYVKDKENKTGDPIESISNVINKIKSVVREQK